MLLIVMLGLALVLVAARLAPVLNDAARARTAADAAALAGAAEGRAAAESIAAANDAALVSYSRSGTTVTVVVRIGDVEARARAAATIIWVPD